MLRQTLTFQLLPSITSLESEKSSRHVTNRNQGNFSREERGPWERGCHISLPLRREIFLHEKCYQVETDNNVFMIFQLGPDLLLQEVVTLEFCKNEVKFMTPSFYSKLWTIVD